MKRVLTWIMVFMIPATTVPVAHAQVDWRDNPVVQRSERLAEEAAQQRYGYRQANPPRHTLNDRPDHVLPPYDPIGDARETDEFFMMQDQTEALQGIERALNDRNMMEWNY